MGLTTERGHAPANQRGVDVQMSRDLAVHGLLVAASFDTPCVHVTPQAAQ